MSVVGPPGAPRLSGILFGFRLYGARSGRCVNAPYIGSAARSSWFIGRDAEDLLDRLDHIELRVVLVIDTACRVGADHERRTAVAIDVIDAVLGVVLDHEDRGALPEAAVGDLVDHPADGEVVVGHLGNRVRDRGAVGYTGGPGVVRHQPHEREVGHLPGLHLLLEHREPLVDAVLIRDRELEVREARIGDRLQRRNVRMHPRVLARIADRLGALVPVLEPLRLRVPRVPVGSVRRQAVRVVDVLAEVLDAAAGPLRRRSTGSRRAGRRASHRPVTGRTGRTPRTPSRGSRWPRPARASCDHRPRACPRRRSCRGRRTASASAWQFGVTCAPNCASAGSPLPSLRGRRAPGRRSGSP